MDLQTIFSNSVLCAAAAAVIFLILFFIIKAIHGVLDAVFRALPVPVSALLCGVPLGLLTHWIAEKLYQLHLVSKDAVPHEFAPEKVKLTAAVFIAAFTVICFIKLREEYGTSKGISKSARAEERKKMARVPAIARSNDFHRAVSWLSGQHFDWLSVSESGIQLFASQVERNILGEETGVRDEAAGFFPLNLRSEAGSDLQLAEAFAKALALKSGLALHETDNPYILRR